MTEKTKLDTKIFEKPYPILKKQGMIGGVEVKACKDFECLFPNILIVQSISMKKSFSLRKSL